MRLVASFASMPRWYVYDDVTYVYDDVTYVYDDVTYVLGGLLRQHDSLVLVCVVCCGV
jgi:hypothetical protein